MLSRDDALFRFDSFHITSGCTHSDIEDAFAVWFFVMVLICMVTVEYIRTLGNLSFIQGTTKKSRGWICGLFLRHGLICMVTFGCTLEM